MRVVYPFFWAILLVICSLLAAHLSSENFLRAEIKYVDDPSGKLTIDEILTKEFSKVQGPALAPVSDTVWLKILLPKQLETWPSTILFSGTNETALSMHAFFQDEHQISNLGFCDVKLDSDACRVSTLQYAFPVPKSSGHNGVMFIKVVPGAAGINNEFYFMHRPYFNKVTIFLTNFVGVASGVFLFVTLLAFILFLSFREKSFLVYGLFYLNLLVSITVNRGVWDAFKPDVVMISGTTLMVPVLTLATFFDLLFLKVFFNMREKNLRLNVVYLFSLGIMITAVFIGLMPDYKILAWTLQRSLFFLSMLLAAGTLIYFNYQGRSGAFILANAWGLAIACNLIWAFYRAGRIEGFWLFGYYALIGRVIGALVLLLALLQKLRSLNIKVGYAKAKEDQGSIVKTLLRTLSHDLANKTQIIRMSAERLEQNQAPDAIARHIGKIISASEDQSKIIQHARRNYSLRGDQVLNLSPVDLVKSVRSVVESYEQSLVSKDIKVELNIPNEPTLVWAEEVSLAHQVLANLLSNSIKFTHSGGSISFSISSQEEHVIELKITDTGIGIPAAIQDRMFDESEIVRRPGTNGELGTGSGLLIVRDFVSAYGATLRFQSRVGAGTTAILRFKKFE